MVKKRTIDARLRDLEERLIEPPRRACRVCGEVGGGRIVHERHTLSGEVVFDPHPPCPGCAQVRPGLPIRAIVICALHTRGLSCPTCKEQGRESPEDLAVRRERFLMTHPEEAGEEYGGSIQ
jgi:hypothetical protein